MSGMKFEKEIFMKYLIEREASEATKKKYMNFVFSFFLYDRCNDFLFLCSRSGRNR